MSWVFDRRWWEDALSTLLALAAVALTLLFVHAALGCSAWSVLWLQ